MYAFDGALMCMLLSADAAAYLKQRVLSLEAELATLKWHADSISLSASGTAASAALAYAPGVASVIVPPLIALLEPPLTSTVLTSLPPSLAADPAPAEMTEHCLVATGMQHPVSQMLCLPILCDCAKSKNCTRLFTTAVVCVCCHVQLVAKPHQRYSNTNLAMPYIRLPDHHLWSTVQVT